MSPYVGMTRKQDGGSNGCISNYTTITQLGASVTHFEAVFYPFQALPYSQRDGQHRPLARTRYIANGGNQPKRDTSTVVLHLSSSLFSWASALKPEAIKLIIMEPAR